MESTQDKENISKEVKEEFFVEPESGDFAESLLRGMVKAYEAAYNKNNQKNEIKFTLTVTNHKVATEDGNKNVAYLRLDRSIREKGEPKLIEQEGKPPIIDEGWETKLVHQEVYFFKNLKEQLNPHSKWKEQLYMNVITRVFGAGLEYAELLNRLNPAKKKLQEEARPKTEEEQTQERMDKLGLVSSGEMPKPLTKDEQEYKEWVKNNNVYGKQGG